MCIPQNLWIRCVCDGWKVLFFSLLDVYRHSRTMTRLVLPGECNA